MVEKITDKECFDVSDNQPLCNVSGLICLSKDAKSIKDLAGDNYCACYHACSEDNYALDKIKASGW
jgi:hypothetical protein